MIETAIAIIASLILVQVSGAPLVELCASALCRTMPAVICEVFFCLGSHPMVRLGRLFLNPAKPRLVTTEEITWPLLEAPGEPASASDPS
jgi:hypothetical protein